MVEAFILFVVLFALWPEAMDKISTGIGALVGLVLAVLVSIWMWRNKDIVLAFLAVVALIVVPGLLIGIPLDRYFGLDKWSKR
jgi:ABC-type spermidine/putrescine transport system permease subunit II